MQERASVLDEERVAASQSQGPTSLVEDSEIFATCQVVMSLEDASTPGWWVDRNDMQYVFTRLSIY